MNISVERDDDQILALYVTLKDTQVVRTVEIEEGVCYADEDAEGNLIGVELLAPGRIQFHIKNVANRYTGEPEIETMLTRAFETVNI